MPIDLDRPFKTAPCRGAIASLFIDCCKQSQRGRFSRSVCQLDEVLGCIVETAFSLHKSVAVEEGFPELTVGGGEALFVSDDAVGLQCVLEERHGFIPMRLPCLLHPKVMIEDAERAIIIQ